MKVLRAFIYVIGLGATIFGVALCLGDVYPQSGVYVILFGLAVSGLVDALEGNFNLLRVGVRGVILFALLSAVLSMRSSG